MALSIILRKTVSTLLPLTSRAVGTQRNYFTPLKNNGFSLQHHRRTLPSALNFSSLSKKPNSDEHLLRIIESEIRCAEDDDRQVDKIPDRFPFKIQDEPGKQTISLRRQYQDETIKVEVHVPDLAAGEENNEEDNGDNSESDSGGQPSIALVVSVSKGKNQPWLEFGCTAYPDEIAIDSLLVKDPDTSEDDLVYEGPDFSDLEESLQKAFNKYLEERGIKPSTTNFLYEYMINKESKEYLMWLQNVKNFVQK